MAKRRQSARQRLVNTFKKNDYETQTFPSEAEAFAFTEGLNAAIVPWKTDVDYEILPPLAKKKQVWTIYYKTQSYDEDE